MSMHVRRVRFIFGQDGYRPMTTQEQLQRGEGRLDAWCGEQVVPSETERIFVSVDSLFDNVGQKGWEVCPACRLAIIAELSAPLAEMSDTD